uniref:PX protein n=1 Tax=Cardioderma bat adenovirus TaxID=3141913 RepID=A0AAU7E153_9ADEN
MAPRREVTVRLRVPVRTRRGRLLGSGARRKCGRRRRLRGGFLPALIPIIAAAIGAVPGIASVALQASRKGH